MDVPNRVRATTIRQTIKTRAYGVGALGRVAASMDPKPGPKPSYASRERKHKAEFKANSHKVWIMNTGLCEDCLVEYVPMWTPAHHIVAAGLGGFRDNSVDNLATLCRVCHDERHGIFEGG